MDDLGWKPPLDRYEASELIEALTMLDFEVTSRNWWRDVATRLKDNPSEGKRLVAVRLREVTGYTIKIT